MHQIQMQESEAVTMANGVSIDRMAEEIMKGLTEYADLATEDGGKGDGRRGGRHDPEPFRNRAGDFCIRRWNWRLPAGKLHKRPADRGEGNEREKRGGHPQNFTAALPAAPTGAAGKRLFVKEGCMDGIFF